MTASSKEIKNKEETLLLSEAVWESAAGAVIPCRGHQRADTPQAKGTLANRMAKQAAAQDNTAAKLTATPVVSSLLTTQAAPADGKEETTCARTEQGMLWEDGWCKLSDGRLRPLSVGISIGCGFPLFCHSTSNRLVYRCKPPMHNLCQK